MSQKTEEHEFFEGYVLQKDDFFLHSKNVHRSVAFIFST